MRRAALALLAAAAVLACVDTTEPTAPWYRGTWVAAGPFAPGQFPITKHELTLDVAGTHISHFEYASGAETRTCRSSVRLENADNAGLTTRAIAGGGIGSSCGPVWYDHSYTRQGDALVWMDGQTAVRLTKRP